MSVPTDPGASLLDNNNVPINNQGATGLAQRFANLYNMFNAGVGFDNMKLGDDFDWTGTHTFRSTKLKVRSSGAAFDLIFAVATAFTANRTFTLDLGDASRSLTLGGNVALAGALTTAGALVTSGAFSITLTATANTNVTLPTTGTLATLAGSETFTNKTITAPIITAPKVTTSSFSNLGNSGTGTITADLTTANTFKVTATGNFTLAFSNPGAKQKFTLIIQQDGTGSRTVTWPSTIRWLNGTGATNSTTDAPTLTTTASKFDVFTFYYDDDLSLYIGTVAGFKGAIT